MSRHTRAASSYCLNGCRFLTHNNFIVWLSFLTSAILSITISSIHFSTSGPSRPPDTVSLYKTVWESLCASWLQSSVSCYTCKGSFIVSQKASCWVTWQMRRICAAVIKIRGLIKLCNLHSLPLSFTRAYQITLVMRMAINCWQRNSCASEVWAPDVPKWQ